MTPLLEFGSPYVFSFYKLILIFLGAFCTQCVLLNKQHRWKEECCHFFVFLPKWLYNYIGALSICIFLLFLTIIKKYILLVNYSLNANYTIGPVAVSEQV